VAVLGLLSGVDAFPMLVGLAGGSEVAFETFDGAAEGFVVTGREVALWRASLLRDFRSLAITHQPMSR
jgi:hypothetical protein